MEEGNPRVSTELVLRKRLKNREMMTSPEKSPVWIEPQPKPKTRIKWKKAAVVYYLSRNGHLEHPHLIQVPFFPTSPGLYLRDVINSLNLHRGKGMASMYSWSSKRSYKNGYVWHDVSEDDLIHSTNGHDYILKGTQLLHTSSPDSRSHETNSSTQTPPDPETNTSGEDSNSPAAIIRRRNQSWSSFDNPREYMVYYKCESNRELAEKFAADAATQTTEERQRRSGLGETKKKECVEEMMVSPPQLNASDDDGSSGSASELRDVDPDREMRDRTVEDRFPSGRMKVLMQLISCGTVSIKDGVLKNKQECDFDERK